MTSFLISKLCWFLETFNHHSQWSKCGIRTPREVRPYSIKDAVGSTAALGDGSFHPNSLSLRFFMGWKRRSIWPSPDTWDCSPSQDCHEDEISKHLEKSLAQISCSRKVILSLTGEKLLKIIPKPVVPARGSRMEAQWFWPLGLLTLWHVRSSQTRDQIHVPCISRWILNYWPPQTAHLP